LKEGLVFVELELTQIADDPARFAKHPERASVFSMPDDG
jgi:hypothetical protein